jgi:hypothetical protein
VVLALLATLVLSVRWVEVRLSRRGAAARPPPEHVQVVWQRPEGIEVREVAEDRLGEWATCLQSAESGGELVADVMSQVVLVRVDDAGSSRLLWWVEPATLTDRDGYLRAPCIGDLVRGTLAMEP